MIHQPFPGNDSETGRREVGGLYRESSLLQVADSGRFKAGTGQIGPLKDGIGEYFVSGAGCNEYAGCSKLYEGAKSVESGARFATDERDAEDIRRLRLRSRLRDPEETPVRAPSAMHLDIDQPTVRAWSSIGKLRKSRLWPLL